MKLPRVNGHDTKSLEDMANIMREEHNEKERLKQEQELMEYALNKIKDVPPRLPMVSGDDSNRPVRVGSQKGELVPYHISETEKRIWEEFNS